MSAAALIGSGFAARRCYRKSKAVQGTPDPKGGVETITPLIAYKQKLDQEESAEASPKSSDIEL